MPAFSGSSAVHTFSNAFFVTSDSALPPVATQTRWQKVSLPDLWQFNHPDYGGNIWYRMTLHLDKQPDMLWGIYLPRINMNAAVFVNGVMVGNGGRFEQPMARNWNRPLYFTVPSTLWNVGENTIMVRVQADKNCRGGLYPLQLGPDALLYPDYRQALTFQVELLQILFVLSLCASLVTFILWLLRYRSDAMYGWYALGTFFWAVYIQYFFVRDISVSAHSWMWLTFSSAYGMIISMMLFCQKFMQLKCDWCLKVMPLYGLSISVLLYATELDSMFDMIGISFIGIMLFVLFMFGQLARYTYRHRNLETLLLAVGVLVNVTFGIHDLLTLMFVWSPPSYLLHYGVPVMFIAMGMILINRFLSVLTQSERLNLELDSRVAQREQELSLLHEALRETERQETISQERERMVEDLHDGMGGQLVAALSLLDKPDTDAALRQTLEDILLDFRLMIDSMDEDSHDISTLLGMLRMRLETQLQTQNIQLQWHLVDGPELKGFSPENSLHILRIVQEAITNAIRHAGASRVDISIMAADGMLHVRIGDNGSGMTGDRRGRGLNNMHKRAAKISAQLDIASTSQGMVVSLLCPL